MWAILNYLTSMWAILNLFWNLIFYLSLLRMLFLTSNFVYQSCQELAALRQREKLTSRAISTASQTPHIKTPHIKTPHSKTPHSKTVQSNPNLTPPSLKPLPPSNPAASQHIIDKYPYRQLKDVKNEFHELREENCDFEETNSWCQCSCVIS